LSKESDFEFKRVYSSGEMVLDRRKGKKNPTYGTMDVVLEDDGQEQVVVQETSSSSEEYLDTDSDFGNGIITKRLHVDGTEIVLVDEDAENAKDGNRNKVKSAAEREHSNLVKEYEDQAIFKSRKLLLEQVLGKRRVPPTITNLKIMAIVVVFAMLLLSTLEYVLTVQRFHNTTTILDQFVKSYEQNEYMQSILYDVRSLSLLANVPSYTSSRTWDDIQASMYSAAEQVETIENYLELLIPTLVTRHQEMMTEESVYLTKVLGDLKVSERVSALNLFHEMLANSFLVAKMTSEELTMQTPEVEFLIMNGFNNATSATIEISDYYLVDLDDRLDEKRLSLILFLAFSISGLAITVGVFLFTLRKVYDQSGKVMVLFLDIPVKAVHYLSFKCERYITTIKNDIGDAQEGDEVFDLMCFQQELELIHKTEDDRERRSAKKKRAAKQSLASNHVLMRFSLIGLTFIGFFILKFFLATNRLDHLRDASDELENTVRANSFFHWCLNVEREVIFSNNEQVISDRDGFLVSLANIDRMHQVNKVIQREHISNSDLHSDGYLDTFENLMLDDACRYMDLLTVGQRESCPNVSQGVITEGMHTSLARQFENLRLFINEYQKIRQSGEYTQQMSTLLSSKLAIELETMQSTYINATFTQLRQELNDGLEDGVDQFIQTSGFLYGGYILGVAMIFLFAWLRYVHNLTEDILQTKMILSTIPIDLIHKVESIHAFIVGERRN